MLLSNHLDQNTLKDVPVIISNEFGNSVIAWRHYRLTHMDGYMATLPAGYEYHLVWDLPIKDEVDVTFYSAGVYNVRMQDYALITHEFVMLPDHVALGDNHKPIDHNGTINPTKDSHL